MTRAAGIALTGAALVLAALTFNAATLFVPGVAFVALAVALPAWVWLAGRSARVTRRLEADTVVEDEAVEARIVVRRGPLGLPGGEVLDPFTGGAIRLTGSLPALRSGNVTDVRVVARFPRRGRRRFDPPAVALSDPLGLGRLAVAGESDAHALLVLPRTERVRWVTRKRGESLDAASGPLAHEALAATEVDGLRPYRAGTPASRISWPALARGAGLLERRLRAERDTGPLVVLDVRSAADGDPVDASVRAAASLVFELGRRVGCELLLPGERRPLWIEPDLGTWPAAHARLALLEGGPSAPPPSISVRPRAGTIFYVTAEAGRLPGRLLRGGQHSAVLVLPAELDPGLRGAVAFEVSGCRGYVLAAAGGAAPPRERAA